LLELCRAQPGALYIGHNNQRTWPRDEKWRERFALVFPSPFPLFPASFGTRVATEEERMSSTSSSSGGTPSGGGGTAGTSAERAGEFGGLRRSNRIRKPVAGATTTNTKENAAASADGSGALAAGADDGDTGAPWTEAEVTQFYHGTPPPQYPPLPRSTKGRRRLVALLHTCSLDLLAVGWPHHTGLRQHGRAWKKIASELKNRTPEMVAALYEQNGGYLSLPPEHTSALVRVPFFIAFQPPPAIWFGPVLLLWVHLLGSKDPAHAHMQHHRRRGVCCCTWALSLVCLTAKRNTHQAPYKIIADRHRPRPAGTPVCSCRSGTQQSSASDLILPSQGASPRSESRVRPPRLPRAKARPPRHAHRPSSTLSSFPLRSAR
jgi:hypothetical protein